MLRNVLAVIGGIFIGSIINFAIVNIGASFIPAPEGVNPMDVESIKSNLHLFQPKHFIMPLLAHALGVLAGAFIACKIGESHHRILAIVVGAVFMLAGISMAVMIPHWMAIVDIVVAYIPMALLGWMLTGNQEEKTYTFKK